MYRKQKNNQSFDLKDGKALPGSFMFTTPVPMVITILEITVPARREPTMTSFVFLSNVSGNYFRTFLLKVWLSSLSFKNAFHGFID